jgi:hypothetical protein
VIANCGLADVSCGDSDWKLHACRENANAHRTFIDELELQCLTILYNNDFSVPHNDRSLADLSALPSETEVLLLGSGSKCLE